VPGVEVRGARGRGEGWRVGEEGGVGGEGWRVGVGEDLLGGVLPGQGRPGRGMPHLRWLPPGLSAAAGLPVVP